VTHFCIFNTFPSFKFPTSLLPAIDEHYENNVHPQAYVLSLTTKKISLMASLIPYVNYKEMSGNVKTKAKAFSIQSQCGRVNS
jgi:hypothetical protein